MRVLSLFDGIGCARVALERAGIKVDAYYASEIEPGSIKIAKKNYPDTVELGDVRKVSYKDGVLYSANGSFAVGRIDLVCGGSPCTNFSSVGYANGMSAGEMEVTSLIDYQLLQVAGVKFDGQSYLFWEFVRIMQEVNPTYFLLENVKMAKKWEKVITKAMGVEPVRINSSLLSAQNRPRLYWTNVPDVSVPKDKGILLDDVLDPDACNKDYTHALTIQRAFPRLIRKYGYVPARFNAYNASEITDKACALSRGSMVTSSCATTLFVPALDGRCEVSGGLLNGKYKTTLPDGRYNLRKLSIRECERLQTLPDDYTLCDGVTDHKKSEAIGNGWTVDVIAHLFSGMKG